MAKTISDRLLKPGDEPLASGQAVFSHRVWQRSVEPSTQVTSTDDADPMQAALAANAAFWVTKDRASGKSEPKP